MAVVGKPERLTTCGIQIVQNQNVPPFASGHEYVLLYSRRRCMFPCMQVHACMHASTCMYAGRFVFPDWK